MGDSHEGRISRLEANEENNAKTIDAIWRYMDEGIKFRETVMISLATLSKADHETRLCAQDKRIISLETSRTRQKGFIAGMLFLGGIIGGGIDYLLRGRL